MAHAFRRWSVSANATCSARHDTEILAGAANRNVHPRVEPTLQRELKHKGAANGDGSYSAELIGYVEIVAQAPEAATQ